jgi:hypothetical protein
VRLAWNPEFNREVEAYDLRYTCVDCGHFSEARQVCAHGWPRTDHLQPHTASEQPDPEVVFCKEFELR